MFDNTAWQAPVETKPVADPRRMSTLVAWLRLQPTEGRYVWADAQVCLLGQYASAHGVTFSDVHHLERQGNWLALNRPHTFGAALRRAERALRREQGVSEIGFQCRRLLALLARDARNREPVREAV